jgi:hypothetical protein
MYHIGRCIVHSQPDFKQFVNVGVVEKEQRVVRGARYLADLAHKEGMYLYIIGLKLLCF